MSYHAYSDGSGGYYQQSAYPQAGIQGYPTSYMAPPLQQPYGSPSLAMQNQGQLHALHGHPQPEAGAAKKFSAKKGPENLSRDGKSWKPMPKGLPPDDETLEENREKLMRLKMDAMMVREANRHKLSSAPKAPPPAKAFVSAASSASPSSPATSQSQQRTVPSSRERVRQYSHHIAPMWQAGPSQKAAAAAGSSGGAAGGMRSSFEPQNGRYDDEASSIGYDAPSESLYEEGSPLESPHRAHLAVQGYAPEGGDIDPLVPSSPSKSMMWSAQGSTDGLNILLGGHSNSPSPFPFAGSSRDIDEPDDDDEEAAPPVHSLRQEKPERDEPEQDVIEEEAPPPPPPPRAPPPAPPAPVKKAEPVRPVKVDALLTLAESSKSKEAQDKAARLKAIASMLEGLD